MLFRSRMISTDEHRHRREQEPLVSGVEKITMAPEDSIVFTPLFPHGGSMDLGARSLVSGVGCNVPGFFPKLELPVILFSHHHDISIMRIAYFGNKNYFY